MCALIASSAPVVRMCSVRSPVSRLTVDAASAVAAVATTGTRSSPLKVVNSTSIGGGTTWPRISPPGKAGVCTLAYRRPAWKAASWSAVRLPIPTSADQRDKVVASCVSATETPPALPAKASCRCAIVASSTPLVLT